MYSRFPGRTDRPIRLPENYSGCAFSSAPPQVPSPPEAPSEHPPMQGPFTSMPPPEAPPKGAMPKEEDMIPPGPMVSPPPDRRPPEIPDTLRSLFGGKFPAFPGGMDFDELLLLGLIILLSHTEQQSDIVLWLALLLFCK